MDIIHGHSSLRGSCHCWRIRQETVLVRSGTKRKALQNFAVSVLTEFVTVKLNIGVGVQSYHARAIRSLHFHPSYPLFASSSDDGSIQVFHSRVYNDLMTDPLIVPLKILRGHNVNDGLGVLQVKWVNRQPWLVSAGADGKVIVWCSS